MTKLKVGTRLATPHRLVEISRKEMAARDDGHRRTSKHVFAGKDGLDVHVSGKHATRALLIMDALLKEFERRGWPVNITGEYRSQRTVVQVSGQELAFTLRENVVEQRAEDAASGRREFDDTGVFTLEVREQLGVRHRWKDTRRRKIEDLLESFVDALPKIAAAKAEKEAECNRRWDAWEDQRRRARAEEEAAASEAERRKALVAEVAAWRTADELRTFVEVARQQRGDKWAVWASAVANELDPLSECG